MATISKLSVSLTARTRGFRKGMARAKNTLKSFVGSIFNVKTAVIGLVGAAGIGFLSKGIIDINTKFQTLKSSLKTMTGGTKQAASAFKTIKKFAATTPFDLDQVVSGFIKLKALGLDPSEAALKSYGNTASAMGKTLNDMIEAVADASTGEFERLKEFGIKAKSEADKVTFTFQGVATTVEKNAKAIEGYLMGIGNNTFGTAMSDQMENLKPAFSNLGDAWDELATKIGDAGINDLVVGMANMAEDFIRSITVEQVEKFTKAVVDMGFWLARSFISGILWIGEFFTEFTSFEQLWIRAKLGVAEFGSLALYVFRTVQVGFTKMIGGMYDLVRDIPSSLGGQKLRDMFAGIFEGAVKGEGFIQGLQDSVFGTIGGLEKELASQVRIDQSRKEADTFAGKLDAFGENAFEAVDKLEKIFLGDRFKKLVPAGTDPRSDAMVEVLKDIRGNTATLQFGGPATAG